MVVIWQLEVQCTLMLSLNEDIFLCQYSNVNFVDVQIEMTSEKVGECEHYTSVVHTTFYYRSTMEVYSSIIYKELFHCSIVYCTSSYTVYVGYSTRIFIFFVLQYFYFQHFSQSGLVVQRILPMERFHLTRNVLRIASQR